jgi:HK97 family phage major capsid protein
MEKAPRAEQIADYLEEHLGKDIAAKMKASTALAREQNKAEGIDAFTASAERTNASGITLTERRKAFAQKFKSQDSRDSQMEDTELGYFIRSVAKTGHAFTPQNFEAAMMGFDPSKVCIEAWRKHNKYLGDKGYHQKALGEIAFIDGGAIVPPQFVTEVIEFLRAKVVIRALGARVIPMPKGNITMPFASTGIVASTVTENTVTPSSQPTFNTFQLIAKKLRALTPISNELLSDASPEADQFVQQDMVAAIRVLEDFNMLRGSGYAGSMRGLRNLAQTNLLATNAAGTAGSSTTSEIIKDLMLMLSGVEGLNITIENGGWVLAPRVKNALMSLRDGIGNFYFKTEMLQGRLWGHNWGSTTAQPVNLDTTSGALSGKESEVLFADFDKVIIGDTQELMIEPFRGGAYYDGSTIQSGISNDQTVIVGQTRSDINERYRGASIANLTRVTWGA